VSRAPRAATRRLHHVANGTCTTRLIDQAGIPGTVSIWADPLYEGPVPGNVTDAELVQIRSRYLAGASDGPTFVAWTGTDASLDPVNDLREWRAAIDRHDGYDELVLWFEHDLFDQLNLVQLLVWIHERLPESKLVSLVCIGSFPGHPSFKGLGELTPEELASLMDARQPVGESQFALASLAWDAFRQPTPEVLAGLRRADTRALPFLGAAIERFLEEYPWTSDGLSRSERRLLDLAAGGSISLSTAFPQMHVGEEIYYLTDASLAAMAEELFRSLPPLLTLAVDPADRGNGTLRGTIALTDVGRAVLAGRQDRVETCGIDRWLGGVHLQQGGPIWRWDQSGKQITKQPS
jgi:hypothetical protein